MQGVKSTCMTSCMTAVQEQPACCWQKKQPHALLSVPVVSQETPPFAHHSVSTCRTEQSEFWFTITCTSHVKSLSQPHDNQPPYSCYPTSSHLAPLLMSTRSDVVRSPAPQQQHGLSGNAPPDPSCHRCTRTSSEQLQRRARCAGRSHHEWFHEPATRQTVYKQGCMFPAGGRSLWSSPAHDSPLCPDQWTLLNMLPICVHWQQVATHDENMTWL